MGTGRLLLRVASRVYDLRMKTSYVVALTLLMFPASLAAQAQNPTNIFVADLTWIGNRLAVDTPVKLTHDEGSNSQPSFAPDGRAIVFSAVRDTGNDARSDIYRIDLATRVESASRTRRKTRTRQP